MDVDENEAEKNEKQLNAMIKQEEDKARSILTRKEWDKNFD